MQISALKQQGVDSFWRTVQEFRDLQQGNGRLAARRQQQSLAWMWERIDAGLRQSFNGSLAVRALLPQLKAQVLSGEIAASSAARQLLAAWSSQGSSNGRADA